MADGERFEQTRERLDALWRRVRRIEESDPQDCMGEYVDLDGQAAWIAENTDLPLRTVQLVLEIENEYMLVVGIGVYPGDYQFRFYDPDEYEESDFVDEDALARDVARFVGVTPELTRRVLESELKFLQMRGLA